MWLWSTSCFFLFCAASQLAVKFSQLPVEGSQYPPAQGLFNMTWVHPQIRCFYLVCSKQVKFLIKCWNRETIFAPHTAAQFTSQHAICIISLSSTIDEVTCIIPPSRINRRGRTEFETKIYQSATQSNYRSFMKICRQNKSSHKVRRFSKAIRVLRCDCVHPLMTQ